MGVDDLLSTETAIVAAATAAVFSPRTRETIRRGAVLAVAGALKAGDVATGAARGVVGGIRGGVEEASAEASVVTESARKPRSRSTPKAASGSKPARDATAS